MMLMGGEEGLDYGAQLLAKILTVEPALVQDILRGAALHKIPQSVPLKGQPFPLNDQTYGACFPLG